MYKSSVIQIVFVIIGILALYWGLQSLLGSSLALIVGMFDQIKYNFFSFSIIYLFLLPAAYILIGYFLISRSHGWSQWITQKSKLDGDFKIISTPFAILYFLFVMVGTYDLVKELPVFLEKIFTSFSSAVSAGRIGLYQPSEPSKPWSTLFLNLLIPLLLVLLAKDLAAYFSKKMDPGQIVEISELKESSTN